MLNLCVAGDFSLLVKCEEASLFLYPGLIVGEILHELGWTGWGLGHVGLVCLCIMINKRNTKKLP